MGGIDAGSILRAIRTAWHEGSQIRDVTYGGAGGEEPQKRIERLAQGTRRQWETGAAVIAIQAALNLYVTSKPDQRAAALDRLTKLHPDKVDVPPKRIPYFKPGKELKDLINREAEAAEAAAAPTDPAAPPAVSNF